MLRRCRQNPWKQQGRVKREIDEYDEKYNYDLMGGLKG
jgi:hypothetical protein